MPSDPGVIESATEAPRPMASSAAHPAACAVLVLIALAPFSVAASEARAPAPPAASASAATRPITQYLYLHRPPARWLSAPTWYYNHEGAPDALKDRSELVITAIRAAIAQWNAACGIEMSFAGETTARVNVSAAGYKDLGRDGTNVTGWMETDDPFFTAEAAVFRAGPTGDVSVIVEADVRLFSNTWVYEWGTNDLALMLHEFGHALGIGHSDMPNVVMSGPPHTPYNSIAQLQDDDIRACRALYADGTAASGSSNYQGLWWNAPAESESGWGINFAHQGSVIFATWFTYNADGKPWWLSMTAQRTGERTYAGSLVETRGPAFGAVPFDPAAVARTIVGTGTLTFDDGNTGSFAYEVKGVSRAKTITRQAFGPLPACTYGPAPDFEPATNYQDLWWVADGVESGWGLNLTHQGENIFASWFTYDVEGVPSWLSATMTRTALGAFGGRVIHTVGPPFDSDTFDPARVTRTDVGIATIAFVNGNLATFAYTVDGVTRTKTITRQLFAPPAGTLCEGTGSGIE